MTKRALIVLSILVLAGCGDGGGSPTTPATRRPPQPPVTYNGTYTGTSMTWTGSAGQMIVTASTTATQTGANLSFNSLRITSPISTSYGMGAATLTSNTFDGTNQYSSSGCGIVTNYYRGYFSGDGNIMNMTMTLTSNCDAIDVRGEMRR